jgi:hypothetical protein
VIGQLAARTYLAAVHRTVRISAIAGLMALSSCAAQRLAEQKAGFDAAVARCRATTPAQVGNYVPWARCVNAASEQFSPPSDMAAPLIRATRLSLSVKVDRGEMSPTDAGAELARVAFEAHQEQARTNAAILSAMPQLHSTSCYGAGGFVTCSGD